VPVTSPTVRNSDGHYSRLKQVSVGARCSQRATGTETKELHINPSCIWQLCLGRTLCRTAGLLRVKMLQRSCLYASYSSWHVPAWQSLHVPSTAWNPHAYVCLCFWWLWIMQPAAGPPLSLRSTRRLSGIILFAACLAVGQFDCDSGRPWKGGYAAVSLSAKLPSLWRLQHAHGGGVVCHR